MSATSLAVAVAAGAVAALLLTVAPPSITAPATSARDIGRRCRLNTALLLPDVARIVVSDVAGQEVPAADA